MQEDTNTQVKISFAAYYSFVDTIKNDLRSKISEALEISSKTFYNKLNADSWSNIERVKIEEIFQEHLNNLNSKLNQNV